MHIHAEVTGSGPAVAADPRLRRVVPHVRQRPSPALATDHTVDRLGHAAATAAATRPTTRRRTPSTRSSTPCCDLVDDVGAERAVVPRPLARRLPSLEMALAHPDRDRGLVLVDTGPGYRNDAARDGWNRMADGYARDLDDQGPRTACRAATS